MLQVEGLRVGYGGAIALTDCDLEVPSGGCLAILGANGAGKSTLLRTIARLVRERAGDIRLDGRRINRWSPDRAARHGIAFVPEGRRLFAPLSVRENLEVGAARAGRGESARRLDGVLSIFAELQRHLETPVGRLSGGEQQMVAIGRALMGDPSLLLVDELSLGLAPVVVRRMYTVLRSLNASGMSVVVVEQHAELCLATAREAMVLEKGRTIFRGSAAELRARPDLIETAYLGTHRRDSTPGGEAVQTESNGHRRAGSPAVAEVTVALEGPVKRRAEQAAVAAGMDLADWVRQLVNAHANGGSRPDGGAR